MVSKQNITGFIPVASLCMAAIAILLFMTSWGIGTSPDSIAYLGAAQNILDGRGLSLPYGDAPNTPLTFYPPLYPSLLAILSKIGAAPIQVAKFLQIVLFTSLIAFVGVVLRSFFSKSTWLVLLGGFILLTSVPLLTVHVMAWSEALFLIISMLSFYTLAVHIERTSLKLLIIAALLAGAAFLTRYAGAAVIATGILSLLVLGRNTLQRRVKEIFIFIGAGVIPGALWVLNNMLGAEELAGRTISFHPIGKQHVFQLLDTVASWFLLPNSAAWMIKGVILGSIFLIFLGYIIYLWQGRKTSGQSETPFPVFINVLMIFVPVYLGFLILSISFVDANTPLDNRILSPVYLAALVIGLYAVGRWIDQVDRQSMKIAVLAVLVTFTAYHLWVGAVWVRTNQANGIGFSSRAWQNSETLRLVREMPDDIKIYSNAPEGIYLYSSRPSSSLPREVLLTSQQMNPLYENELIELQRMIETCDGVVVNFTDIPRSSGYLLDDLSKRLDLMVIAESSDGEIIGMNNPDGNCFYSN